MSRLEIKDRYTDMNNFAGIYFPTTTTAILSHCRLYEITLNRTISCAAYQGAQCVQLRQEQNVRILEEAKIATFREHHMAHFTAHTLTVVSPDAV